jgi:hypothetical protein
MWWVTPCVANVFIHGYGVFAGIVFCFKAFCMLIDGEPYTLMTWMTGTALFGTLCASRLVVTWTFFWLPFLAVMAHISRYAFACAVLCAFLPANYQGVRWLETHCIRLVTCVCCMCVDAVWCCGLRWDAT